MRLWSIHPKYLDTKGLIALWREGLLAKKVIEGKTKGYKKHPQLNRFRNHRKPIEAITSYLIEVYREAEKRGYDFDKSKIINSKKTKEKIPVTTEQVKFEFQHLLKKLKARDPQKYKEMKDLKIIKTNPIFHKIKGEKENWEKANAF